MSNLSPLLLSRYLYRCIGLLLLLGVCTGVASAKTATSTQGIEISAHEVRGTTTTPTPTVSTTTPGVVDVRETPSQIEEMVRTRFLPGSAMIGIARCESNFRQYTDSGNVLRGGYDSAMIGVFQFDESVHKDRAQELGFDIYTTQGNIAYAEYLYAQAGTDPWISSLSCWHDEDTATATIESSASLTKDLHFGQTDREVRTLQKALYAKGYVIAKSGSGSKGNETTSFGTLTRKAVRAFQCDAKITCAGDEHTTGYGLVNAKTRIALLAGKSKAKSQKENMSRRNTSVGSATHPTGGEMTDAARQKKMSELLKILADLQKQLAVLKVQL